jgi:hypothetical protein
MRKGYWECDNCLIKVFDTIFPKTWIHLKTMMVAEGTCVFGFYRRPLNSISNPVKNVPSNNPNPPFLQPDFSAYRKELDKTFCSKDCFVKYISKMFTSSDASFNPSMKV